MGHGFPCPFHKLAVMQEYTNHSDTTFALRNISFRVPGRTLLHPLSLTFPAGKVTG
ncbi:Fe3+-hydroxamate ABC transporter ATP-binding protein FhuC, partial [Escherichia coli]